MYYAYRCLTDLRSAYVPPYKARPDLLQLLENSRFQNGLSTAASLGEATGLQGDSGAFPTFRQCGQLHQSGQLQPTRPRLQGGAHSVHLCTHLNTCFRYVHILSTAQLLLNVFIWTLWWSAMCSRNVDSMDTLHSFRRGQQQFQGHSGHSCGQWTPVRKLTLLRTCKNLLQKSFAKIIPEIHIPKHPLPTPTEDCKWKRLPSPHRDILGKSLEKIFYLVSLLPGLTESMFILHEMKKITKNVPI